MIYYKKNVNFRLLSVAVGLLFFWLLLIGAELRMYSFERNVFDGTLRGNLILLMF